MAAVASIQKMKALLAQPRSVSFSDEIGSYLDQVRPQALKKKKAAEVAAIEGAGATLRRQNCFKPLRFKLCEEGVDVASSSESESESLQTEEEDDDISSIAEASSGQEESPLKLPVPVDALNSAVAKLSPAPVAGF